mgnify:CR=1 FL=1
MTSPTLLLDASNTTPIEKLEWFFDKGGVFIYCILLCSIAAVAVMLYQFIMLGKSKIMPNKLEDSMNAYLSRGDHESTDRLNTSRKSSPSVLQRLCDVVLERHDRKDSEIQEAVQASAREEIVKMQAGIPILEVIIAIAPLLGLLGTATGLFTVFEGVGSGEGKHEDMAAGISEALITTVSGLAVAVPAVIAHGYFNRRIERYAARLEVVMDKFVGAYSVGRNGNSASAQS